MDKAQLDSSLCFLTRPEGVLQIILYAYLTNGAVKKLDIKDDDLPSLQELFVNSVKNIILDANDFSVIPLSTADERGKCFYQYDLELPQELNILQNVIGNDQLHSFDFSNDSFADVQALVIVLADDNNEVSMFKKLSPVEIIGRSGYMIWKANQRLERFDKQLLRISSSIQVLQVKGEIIILNLSTIEKSLGFYDVIKKEAIVSLKAVKNIGIVSNIETLEELIDDVSFARKLTKIAKSSPVIQSNIPNEHIIGFSKAHPATKNRMRYTEDGAMFLLDTKVSKNLFIKLLNDDFLTSELTKRYYDSLAKDNI